MTVEELFALAPQHVDPVAARGVDRVVDLVVDGERHQLVVRDGAAAITRDGTERPQLTVRMSGQDVLAIAEGRAHPVKLFFAGRIRAEGDLWGSRALKDVFVNPHAGSG
jgi:putative sterol carrier protein